MAALSKLRANALRRLKTDKQRIVLATAYDAITAAWGEAGGADAILVGDSLGNTALGFESTIPVTLDMMVHHCAAVARGARNSLLIGDLPFMTYKSSTAQSMASAARLIQEGGMHAVKLEGGADAADSIAKLVAAGIPVMGHIGVLPQSVHQSGYARQGADEAGAARLLNDARAVGDAGAFAVVLEMVDAALAKRIAEELDIPTIGIGSGPGCDGQVLVLADLLGMTGAPPLPFAKAFANLNGAATEAIRRFGVEVREGSFPETP